MHPVLFRIGPLSFYSYGLAIAVGFLCASALAARRARALGLDPARIQSVALTALAAGLIGGRLAYVLLNWELYRADPWEILRLDHGGLVFYGGLGAGLAAAVAAIRRARWALLPTVDLFIPPLVLAHAIGRIGCFLNGCCYGRFTDAPWGVVFPGEAFARHPTQLYESAALLLIFLGLKRLEARRPAPGAVLLVYGTSYGIWRFAVEFLRGDNPRLWLDLTLFQLASLAVVGLSLLLLLARRRR